MSERRQLKTGNMSMTIYREDLDFFLDCFSTDLDEVEAIGREEGGFIPIQDIAKILVKKKNYSSELTDMLLNIVDRSFPKDFRSGAFERQNFFYGLADHYAETHDEPTYLVEFDVGNCNGTDKYVGNDTLLKVIRYMRFTFEETLKQAGATYVQSFDNAKNDDLKFVVTGLNSSQLTETLESAQKIIFKKFIAASDIPHSKYADGERNGIGVGSGFVKLGRGRSPQLIQERLNLFVEKRKLEDAAARLRIRSNVDTSLMTPDYVRGMLGSVFEEVSCIEPELTPGFPYSLDSVGNITNPFTARQKACHYLAESVEMSTGEQQAFEGILRFYHSSEALTGAQRSNFLLGDIEWVQDHVESPVTILNMKVENCAGINKVLSHIHSAEMTKHFVGIVSNFCKRNLGEETADLVYYVGRNTFNIIVPSLDSDFVQSLAEDYLQQEIDSQINDRLCGEYFGSFGLDVPENLQNKKVGSIPNLRGLDSGVSVINIETRDSTEFRTEADILAFQNKCLSSSTQAFSSSPVTLPEGLTYHDLEQGRSPTEILELLQVMASQIIKREQSEESSAREETDAQIFQMVTGRNLRRRVMN
jgi:hypothetical protein